MKKLLVLLLTVCFSLCCSAQPISELKEKAAQGVVSAQFRLADCYFKGVGVTKDPKQAVYWYRKAAEQGHARAQIILARCYYLGVGVTKDPKQSVYWSRKAAEQGDVEAQFTLALCYYKGVGVTQDPKQAVYWYRKAAEQGDVEAQFTLAKCYEKGEGVTKDPKQAVYWYRKAAEQGHARAQKILPRLEEELNNDGKPKDTSEQALEVVSEMPSFPGGTQGLANYLGQNIKYPEVCVENGVQGRVICSFIVEKDGSISNIEVEKRVDPALDREAVRVIQNMPKWKPGNDHGKAVRVIYHLPINFRL